MSADLVASIILAALVLTALGFATWQASRAGVAERKLAEEQTARTILGNQLAQLQAAAATLRIEAREDSRGMAERGRLLADSLRERYVVTLTTGETFDGLLWDVDAQVLELRDAVTVDAHGRRHTVDGAMVLRRPSVAYMQRPAGPVTEA